MKLLDGIIQYPPPNLNDESRTLLAQAIRRYFSNRDESLPIDLSYALQLLTVLDSRQSLARLLYQEGPHSTSNPNVCKEALRSLGSVSVDNASVASALLFMIVSPDWEQYQLAVFVRVIQELTQAKRLDWGRVVRGFDRPCLKIEEHRFLKLYDALAQVAESDNTFDIQMLWGGNWQWPETQLSFVTVFLSLPPSVLDATQIPRLRPSFTTEDFDDASDEVKGYAAQAVHHTLVSVEAMTALFHIIADSASFLHSQEGADFFHNVVQHNTDVFLCSAMGVPKPWSEQQLGMCTRLFVPFLFKQHPRYAFVLHGLWKKDKNWTAAKLVEAHAQDPLKLPLLFEHAQEHKWLSDLLTILNGFGIDLAALAHRRDSLDLEEWARRNAAKGPEFTNALAMFLRIKAQDELDTAAREQTTPRTVSLAVRTVNTMLEILEDTLSEQNREEDDLIRVQRTCVQAYPRLINYGEGFDDIIDANGEESNAMTEAADRQMQEHYKKMYGGERDVRDIVAALQQYKQSRDPGEQDLFACMIHGLFDEYNCFREYPLEALATTAVLFGGIINFKLISGIPLRVGLGMILEAVRDFGPETSMYKFGLQALLHFFGRLKEWPGFCSLLLQVPGLEGTEAYGQAEEIVRQRALQLQQEDPANNVGQNGVTEPGLEGAGEPVTAPESVMQNFTSLHVDPRAPGESFDEPDESTHDKVLFVLNNISEQNLATKLKDLKEALETKHLQWFATYLVDERAKMQPNYHQLYLEMLNMFDDRTLWSEVLRETYVSVMRMLNAQTTLDSSTERAHLKNLGGWLGSLTIARNKPIKYRNISFKDLLIEAYDTQRLIIVIPFTCKVLAQASKSTVFRPPNPWLMDVLGLLIELYHYAELRLQLKFEIEVLCKDLDLDHTSIEPTTSLRERPHPDEDLAQTTLPEGLDGFDDLSITAGLGRPGTRHERFSPGAITSSLPDIGSLLVYPPTSSTSINRDSLRYIVETAVRKAIQEIISPVVERSVTIAAISTYQLINKDFAMEANEDRVRQSALTMVKALAGSLALVTCKEPLRMSMTNYIRVLSAEVGDQVLPEGAILMCVNDNLDTACSLVESAAEQRSMPEIEESIEQNLAARRRHRATQPNQPFVDPIINRWAFYIPEPYKQSPNGLNSEQMAIYEDFARQSRGPATHSAVSSTDTGRIGGVLDQEAFPSVPNLTTPAEAPALPHQVSQGPQQPSQTQTQAQPQPQQPQPQQAQAQQSQPQPPQQAQPHMQPPPMTSLAAHSTAAPQLNGFTSGKSINEQLNDALTQLLELTKEARSEEIGDRAKLDLSLQQVSSHIIELVANSAQAQDVAFLTAKKICQVLYTELERPLEVRIFIHILRRLCELSPATAREVTRRLFNQEDEQAMTLVITMTLLQAGLTDLQSVDVAITRAIHQRNGTALELLTDLMNEVLFCDHPIALRADFAKSLEAMAQWVAHEPELPVAQELLKRLRDSGVPEFAEIAPDERSRHYHDRMEYAFHEWVRLCSRGGTSEKTFAAFIAQLVQKELLSNAEDSCLFFRICVEASVEAYEQAMEMGADMSSDGALTHVDALAKLVVMLFKFHGEIPTGEVKRSKPAYLHSVLSLIVLTLNHHHVVRGEGFNQKVFFRLFSSILCEHHALRLRVSEPELEQETMLVFGDVFLTLQPAYFPGFSFAWLSLISHRFFMPRLLLFNEQAVRLDISK